VAAPSSDSVLLGPSTFVRPYDRALVVVVVAIAVDELRGNFEPAAEVYESPFANNVGNR